LNCQIIIVTYSFEREYNFLKKGAHIMSTEKKKNIKRYKKDYLNEESKNARQPLRMQIHTEEK
jgi:hypothetical protein